MLGFCFCFPLVGTPVKNNSTGVVGYEMPGPLQFLVWYHVVGLIWISEFILAFQQMTIAGAVVTYYFTRYKRSNRQQFGFDLSRCLTLHLLIVTFFCICLT